MAILGFREKYQLLLPMKASSSPGEILAGPGKLWFVNGRTGDSRTSMTRRASLLLRRIIMVEREFGGGVGSNKCVAVGWFKHDVLMIQPSDHHKNLVGQSLYAKEGYLKAW